MGAGVLQAQTYFEGTLTYSIQHEGEYSKSFADLLPHKLTVHIGRDAWHLATQLSDGRLTHEAWIGLRSDTTWLLDHDRHTARWQLLGSAVLQAFADTLVKPHGNGPTWFGYPTKVYHTQPKTYAGGVDMWYYVAPSLRVDTTGFRDVQGSFPLFFNKRIEGFPLRVKQYIRVLDLVQQYTVSSIQRKPGTLPPLQIPEGYDVRPFNPMDDLHEPLEP
jgi:hypothetical protein